MKSVKLIGRMGTRTWVSQYLVCYTNHYTTLVLPPITVIVTIREGLNHTTSLQMYETELGNITFSRGPSAAMNRF